MNPPDVFKIVCVDFDKTICDSNYPEILSIKPGAVDGMQRLRDFGYWIMISSCRTCKFYPDIFLSEGEALDMNRPVITDMISFLDKHKVPYDEIDDGTRGKVFAEYYIDDKAIRFENNWPEIVSFIEKRIPVSGEVCLQK